MQIILSSHGELALAFRSFAQLIYGHQERWETLCLGDDVDSFKRSWQGTLQKIKASGEIQILVIVDIPRGTPYNVCLEMATKPEFRELRIQLVTGMSTGLVLGVADAIDDLHGENFEHTIHEIIDQSHSLIRHSDLKLGVIKRTQQNNEDDEL